MKEALCTKKQLEGNRPVLGPNSDSQSPVIVATIPITAKPGEVG